MKQSHNILTYIYHECLIIYIHIYNNPLLYKSYQGFCHLYLFLNKVSKKTIVTLVPHHNKGLKEFPQQRSK